MASETYDPVSRADLDKALKLIKSGPRYYAHHPETNMGVIPFLYNDLAHLTSKGGAVRAYTTSSTDFTAVALTELAAVSTSYANRVFDCTPSYWRITVGAKTDVVVVDITMHKTFSYTTKFYIDFGTWGWRAKTVRFLGMNSDNDSAYTLISETTVNDKSYVFTSKDLDTAAINRLRVVLTDFRTTNARVAQIGVIAPGSPGLSEGFVSRAGSELYGSLLPYSGLSLYLGSSAQRWQNVYTKNLNVSTNASVAALTVSGASTLASLTVSGAATADSLTVGKAGSVGSLTVKATNAQGTLGGRNVTLISPVQEHGGVNTYNVTLPDKAGTLALKSDLDGYLPKTGGTLTGGLSLTTLAATEVTLGGVFRFYTSADSLRVEIGGSHFDVGLNLTPVSS